jgi:protocatechuate 3,4-dioxygenase beta subunit
MLIGSAAIGSSFFLVPGLFAEELTRTPAMTEGPFYPDKLPLDQDNDLIKVGDATTPAIGQITHLTGRILDLKGEPIRGATIEIWQCDANAVYLHSADPNRKKTTPDQGFQGFGRFEANAAGEYRFRTIKPVPYPGRPAPHIHFKVLKGGKTLLTSQIFIAGHEGQKQDGIFQRLRDAADRKRVETEFKPIPDSKIGEFAASFDIVIGLTPSDAEKKG